MLRKEIADGKVRKSCLDKKRWFFRILPAGVYTFRYIDKLSVLIKELILFQRRKGSVYIPLLLKGFAGGVGGDVGVYIGNIDVYALNKPAAGLNGPELILDIAHGLRKGIGAVLAGEEAQLVDIPVGIEHRLQSLQAVEFIFQDA